MKSVMLSILLCGLIGCTKNHLPQQQCMPVVAVYPSWKQQQMPMVDIPWDRFTHLALIFAIPQGDGSLLTTEIDNLIAPLGEAARANGKNFIYRLVVLSAMAMRFNKSHNHPRNCKNLLSLFRITPKNINWME